MSTSNNELKEMLNELADTLLVLVHEQYEAMPNNAKPEVIWTMLAKMTDEIIGVSKRLSTMSDRVSPGIISEGVSKSARAGPPKVQSRSIIKGAQRSSRTGRNVLFDDECRKLPLPRKDLNADCTVRILHEMIFVDSDCFLSLSSIQPGSHGWIIVFRDELKDWLLSAVEPFHVLYEDRHGKRTYFGIYTARLLSRASMNGAEIAFLSDTVRKIIVTALSNSEIDSKPYHEMAEKLLLSLKTLPCVFLQCMEFLPALYPNFMTDVAQFAQSATRKPVPSPPPGLLAPVSASVERKSRHTLSNPPGQPRTVPVLPQSQQTQSSQQVVEPEDNEKTPRGTPAPSTILRKCSGVSNDVPTSYDGRWYNIGDLDSVPRGSRGTFVRHQTWHQNHQNNNLVNNSDRILVPLPRKGPQPLQSSAYSNYQPRNLQSNTSLVSHQGMSPNPPNPGLRPNLQPYSATGVPRGYRVQNQNINPICNPLLINSLQITRSSRGLYRVPDGSLHPQAPARLSPQNFPFPQHRKADPRFRDSQSYRAQRS